jgi:hypothetical protein
VKAGSVDVVKELPIQFRYVKDLYQRRQEDGIERRPRALGQRDAAAGRDAEADSGAAARPTAREIPCVGHQRRRGCRQTMVSLQVPAGWNVSPASAPLEFLHDDESLSARFQVTAPPGERVGTYTLHAVADVRASRR